MPDIYGDNPFEDETPTQQNNRVAGMIRDNVDKARLLAREAWTPEQKREYEAKQAKASTPTRYKLMSDNDGHHYIIPVDKDVAFELWVQATEDGKYTELDFEEYRMNSSGLTFTDPQGWE